MYGIHDDVDWLVLVDQTLLQVCIGKYQVALRFDDAIVISIECDFELVSLATTNRAPTDRYANAAALLSLVDTKITSVATEGGTTLVLRFSNDQVLKIHDSNEGYESFQIHGPGIEIIV
jgi:hypothetical protein